VKATAPVGPPSDGQAGAAVPSSVGDPLPGSAVKVRLHVVGAPVGEPGGAGSIVVWIAISCVVAAVGESAADAPTAIVDAVTAIRATAQ
jgi:hypothetical protein